MTAYLAFNNGKTYLNSDGDDLQNNDKSNRYASNINSHQMSLDLNENKQFVQGIAYKKSIFEESHNTIEKSSDDCTLESRNSLLAYKPSTEINPVNHFENHLPVDVQSLIQRQTQIIQQLEKLDKELLMLLHEEWSITGNVPSDYESLSLKLGIYNKPVKNTSYPLSHVLVHKASTVSMKQEYYEFLKKKKYLSITATNKPIVNVSAESVSITNNSKIDDFSLPNDENVERHKNTARRLVEAFGRSISTELLLQNDKLYNPIDLTDRYPHSNTSSFHDYSSVNLNFDKHQYNTFKTDNQLTPSEYYRLNNVTSMSDYSSFLSADYSPTTSIRSDYRSLKNSVNSHNNNQEVLSDLSSNLLSSINCHNRCNANSRNLNDEKSDSKELKESVNEDLIETNEIIQIKMDGYADNEEEEDTDRIAYEIELRRLEVDFAVISQLYAVHKQRAKETKFESYKIAYKSNSKKLKDITEQMNHIKTVLLSNQQLSKEQPIVSVDRKMIQKHIYKRRKTWNPLKLSSSNWTMGNGTSPRRSKLDSIQFQDFSSPVTPNTTKPKHDIFTERRESTVVGRRIQHTLPRHSKLFYEKSSKCEAPTETISVRQDMDEYFDPNPSKEINVTPIKQDITKKPRSALSSPVLHPLGPDCITNLHEDLHHSSDSNPINTPASINAVVQEKITSQDRSVNKTIVHDRRRKYVKTSKRSHSLSSELFIVSVDDTYNLPHSLVKKIARVRSLPQFNNGPNCSNEYMDYVKKKIVHESYSVDGKLKNLKRQPLSVTTQSSGIGFNNSSASVDYTDALGSPNLNCAKCIPKKTSSSNTSSSNWSTSGCSCLSSQTNSSSPYEECALKRNGDFNVEDKRRAKPDLANSGDCSSTPTRNCSEEATKTKVILRHFDKRGRRVTTPLMENLNAQPFGMSVSARCICSCFSEHGHFLTTAESHICQCRHPDNHTNTNTSIQLNKSEFGSSHEIPTTQDEGNLVSLPSSVCYSEETELVNISSDRLHSKASLDCYSLQTPKSHDESQNKEIVCLQTPNNNSASALKGRLSLKPFSLIRRAVSKVTTNSGRRSLNTNSPFKINKKKCITSPTILPSLTTDRLKEIKTNSATNDNSDTCRKLKCSLSDVHDSLGYQSNPSITTITNNNNNMRRFTWARKIRHSMRPSHVVPNKCAN
ncbi:unnamed protein product [Schistosoma turkestanicum]|nr:unnamed protein product [Schistosoma turkestanicum]